MSDSGHRLDQSTDGYVDIRRLHPDREFRTCVECGHEWMHKHWNDSRGERKEAARTATCPNCRLMPLLERLAQKYAEHVVEMEAEDPGIRPSPVLRRVGMAMAYEASEIVGYEVNPLTCEGHIKFQLPEWHWLSRDEFPGEGYDTGRINEKYRTPTVDTSETNSDAANSVGGPDDA